jgi:hypothetical protein
VARLIAGAESRMKLDALQQDLEFRMRKGRFVWLSSLFHSLSCCCARGDLDR